MARGGAVEAFAQALLTHGPTQSRVIYHETETIPYQEVDGFRIEPSMKSAARVFIPADLCVCEDCLREMHDTNDLRHLHPFISCMSCGPRYSVIERAPYDRETTTMSDFPHVCLLRRGVCR